MSIFFQISDCALYVKPVCFLISLFPDIIRIIWKGGFTFTFTFYPLPHLYLLSFFCSFTSFWHLLRR